MPRAGIKYGSIAKPDYTALRQEAEQAAMAALGLERPEDAVGKVRPDDLVVKAADAVRQADAELALHQDERDAALTSLWFYDPRYGLVESSGLGTMAYRDAIAKRVYGDKKHKLPAAESNEELARVGRELGVTQLEDAEEKLLESAPITFQARIRRSIALRYMQEAVFALGRPPYNWKPEKIAEHAGVTRKLVYKHRDTAAKRHGM
ncbi:hypothetical protein [Streptomyces similanensis]|uniref:Uncharacterized protein n=1 Tax=Streptomyces similanensis TaxID=1274988 RepID=A0ABP9L7Y7_9ACTN